LGSINIQVPRPLSRKARRDDLREAAPPGERSSCVVKTLPDHETFANQEREAIAVLEREALEPIRLPTVEEVDSRIAESI